jgi:methionine-rich copper-binding protein CopC
LAACVALLLLTTPARAHNVLIGSDPKEGATLAAVPGRVTLTFDQAVRRDFARIAVTGPDGAHYEQGEVGVSGPSVFIALRGSAPAGAYSIGYRIVSNDGHPVTGTITFTVMGGGGATAGATSPASATGSTAPQASGAPAPGASGGPAPAGGPVAGPPGGASSALDAAGATGTQGGGGWVWGLLTATAVLLALTAYVLVRHDRRQRSAA